MRKADMIDIKDILRQRHGPGLTRNDIAAAAGVGAGTVSNVLRRAKAAGQPAGRFRTVSTTGLSGSCLARSRPNATVAPCQRHVSREPRIPPERRCR